MVIPTPQSSKLPMDVPSQDCYEGVGDSAVIADADTTRKMKRKWGFSLLLHHQAFLLFAFHPTLPPIRQHDLESFDAIRSELSKDIRANFDRD